MATAGEPAVELPAGAVGQGGGVEQPVVAPHPVQLLPRSGVCLDAEPGRGQSVPGQPLVQRLGERPGGEGGHVDPLERWVILTGHHQVGWWCADRQRTFVHTGRQPVRVGRVEAEPGQHVALGQGGEVGQRPDAQPAQEVGQVGPVQSGHIHPSQKLCRRTGRHDLPFSRREHGREGAVGDTSLGLHATDERDVLDQALGRLLLPAVVTGRPPGGDRARTGPDHLHPGSQLLDRGHDRLVRARVPARVVLHHRQLWTTSLSLPFA